MKLCISDGKKYGYMPSHYQCKICRKIWIDTIPICDGKFIETNASKIGKATSEKIRWYQPGEHK